MKVALHWNWVNKSYMYKLYKKYNESNSKLINYTQIYMSHIKQTINLKYTS